MCDGGTGYRVNLPHEYISIEIFRSEIAVRVVCCAVSDNSSRVRGAGIAIVPVIIPCVVRRDDKRDDEKCQHKREENYSYSDKKEPHWSWCETVLFPLLHGLMVLLESGYTFWLLWHSRLGIYLVIFVIDNPSRFSALALGGMMRVYLPGEVLLGVQCYVVMLLAEDGASAIPLVLPLLYPPSNNDAVIRFPYFQIAVKNAL